MPNLKTALTPEERIRVAFGHLCLGVDQHLLAALYGVNSARVAEAVAAVREAVGIVREPRTFGGGAYREGEPLGAGGSGGHPETEPKPLPLD